jgi:polysaccharide export outer membrane protein
MTPAQANSRTARVPALWAVLAGALLLTACRAPGMKMTVAVPDIRSTLMLNGQKIILQPLDATAVRDFGTPAPANTGLNELMTDRAAPYQVGPQDILLVTVWDHPEITLPLGQYRTDAATGMVIDEEGLLYFPYIGRVKVGGLSVVQVRDILTSRLSKVLKLPQVDVKVVAFRSQKIYIGGEVRLPAVHTVTDVAFTLAEAINRAGGFLPSADQSRLVVSRGNRSWTLNFLDLLAHGNLIEKIVLKDGDSIHVHHRNEAPVYVLGEVQHAMPVPAYNGKLTLAQALTEAGGINNLSADPRSIYVFRRGVEANQVEVFHLDAYNPVGMVMADRFSLQPRDVVYVDAGTLVRWNRVVSLIAPTTTILTGVPSVAADSRTAFK